MIVFIAPYEKLKNIADSIADDYDIEIKTHIGDLSEGVKIADRYRYEHGCIFVSRGGTASLIKKQLEIPVIEVGVSFYDLLENLKKLKGLRKKIAIVGFENLTHPAKAICNILDIPAEIFTLESDQDLPDIMSEIADKEADIVIGDVISVKKAEEYNLNYLLIESGREALKEAFEKAVLIYKSTKDHLENAAKINAILNSVSEGIINIDKKGIIRQINQQGLAYLGTEFRTIPGKHISDIIPSIEYENLIKKNNLSAGGIFNLSCGSFAYNTRAIIISGKTEGLVISFLKSETIRDFEITIRKQLQNKGHQARYTFQDIFYVSSCMKDCIAIAKQYSRNRSNIIIYGETGTGKELVAQSIHNNSPVHDGAFIAVNCAALTDNLLESELFGYIEGAFTGASKSGHHGLFEAAHNGTIFLDEISEIDINLQTKLLRVLQEKEIRRIGDDKIIPINVRIIAATNRNLEEEILKGKFRKDLYYRLNVLEINIPPLRQRVEDILPIFEIYIKKYSGNTIALNSLSSSFKKILKKYYWPGNIRELENMAERFSILYNMNGNEYAEKNLERLFTASALSGNYSIGEGSLAEIENRIIKKIFEEENRNISRTARRLVIDRNTLKKKLAGELSIIDD